MGSTPSSVSAQMAGRVACVTLVSVCGCVAERWFGISLSNNAGIKAVRKSPATQVHHVTWERQRKDDQDYEDVTAKAVYWDKSRFFDCDKPTLRSFIYDTTLIDRRRGDSDNNDNDVQER